MPFVPFVVKSGDAPSPCGGIRWGLVAGRAGVVASSGWLRVVAREIGAGRGRLRGLATGRGLPPVRLQEVGGILRFSRRRLPGGAAIPGGCRGKLLPDATDVGFPDRRLGRRALRVVAGGRRLPAVRTKVFSAQSRLPIVETTLFQSRRNLPASAPTLGGSRGSLPASAPTLGRSRGSLPESAPTLGGSLRSLPASAPTLGGSRRRLPSSAPTLGGSRRSLLHAATALFSDAKSVPRQPNTPAASAAVLPPTVQPARQPPPLPNMSARHKGSPASRSSQSRFSSCRLQSSSL